MDKNVKICVLGTKGAGKTTLISAISKFGGNYIKTSDIENKLVKKEKYNIIEVNLVMDERNYTFYEFPTTSDIEKFISADEFKFDAAILVVDSTTGFPEEEIDLDIELLNHSGCYVFTFISKPDVSSDIELIELIQMNLDEIFDDEAELKDYGSLVGAIEESDDNSVSALEHVMAYVETIAGNVYNS